MTLGMQHKTSACVTQAEHAEVLRQFRGIYLARLVLDGIAVGECKFTVVK